MKKKSVYISIFIALTLTFVFYILIRNGNMQLLDPQGYIAQKQSVLLWTALALGVLIGFPVVGATLLIVFKFREENNRTDYSPKWKPGKDIVAAWWIAPAILVAFWAVVGWHFAHLLDPYKPINAGVKPVEIQVVALQWKWLFIYPQEHIATVNYIEFPANTPVHFQLTADAPMNSFWIPKLGGQIYAMTGMVTQINLIANTQGEFPGGGAEMSGEGFAGMDFMAKATSNTEYQTWLQSVRQSNNSLNLAKYNSLAKPSSYNSAVLYYNSDDNLFNEIVNKYMSPDAHI